MPLYDFDCVICLHRFERIMPAKRTYRKCPKCGAFVERNFPAPNFRVTGFNSINGYNLPKYEDLLDENGYQKKGYR